MSSICAEFDLCDLHDRVLGDCSNVSTYIRGHNKLDYIFTSSELVPYSPSCGINKFNKLVHSDHRALFADFDLAQLVSHSGNYISRPDIRFISSNSHLVATFVNKAYDHLDLNQVFHLSAAFKLDVGTATKPWVQANKIDTLIGQAFQCAEKHCAKPIRPPWSEKLHKASKKVRFWKTALTQFRTGVDHSGALTTLSYIIWGPSQPMPFIPSHLRALKSITRAAVKNLRHVRRNAMKERKEFLQL